MKRSFSIFVLSLATFAVFATVFTGSQLFGQAAAPAAGAAPAAPPTRVGIVDIVAVMTSHPLVVAKRAEIDAKAKTLQAQFGARIEDLNTKMQQLQQMQPSSPNYSMLNDDIIRAQLDMEKDKKLIQMNLVKDEVKTMLDAYKNVKTVIDSFANTYGFAVILAVQRPGQDVEDAVMQGAAPADIIVGQQVLWVYPQLDLTKYVQDTIAKQYPNVPTGGAATPAMTGAAPQAPRR